MNYAESNYFRKVNKFKKLYELLDDMGSVNIKIADLGNACWEVIIMLSKLYLHVYNVILKLDIEYNY